MAGLVSKLVETPRRTFWLKWRFPKIGVPLNHPFIVGGFHHKPTILGTYICAPLELHSGDLWEVAALQAQQQAQLQAGDLSDSNRPSTSEDIAIRVAVFQFSTARIFP